MLPCKGTPLFSQFSQISKTFFSGGILPAFHNFHFSQKSHNSENERTHLFVKRTHLFAKREHTCSQRENTPVRKERTHLFAKREHTCSQRENTPVRKERTHLFAKREHTCSQSLWKATCKGTQLEPPRSPAPKKNKHKGRVRYI
jgi:hypothetical protein